MARDVYCVCLGEDLNEPFLFMTHFWLSRGYFNFLIPAFTLNYSLAVQEY